MMNLTQTVPNMISKDYKDRFVAEYFQTKIRFNRLRHLIVKYDANVLDKPFDCPIELLRKQLQDMDTYLYDLEVRAELEAINLNECGNQIVRNS